MSQEEIVLKLSPEEINILLEGVGALPFVKVYALIAKIQAQASAQLTARTDPSAPAGAGEG